MTDDTLLNFREYIVTLYNYDELDLFYKDMEDPSNNNYTPDRPVGLVDRRDISRNTHYMLTDSEAEKLRADPRVMSVELAPDEAGIIMGPCWAVQEPTIQTFDKSTATSATVARNWGVYRCNQAANPMINGSAWGYGGTTAINAALQLQPTGKNVDVVILDYGVPDPAHPEYAVNADGTGGTRVRYFNWVPGTAYPTIPTTGVDVNSYHSWHCLGIAAGNRQGWARDSNMYVASLGVNSNIFDYVRQWHINKPINPSTGRKNPTVINMSIASVLPYAPPGTSQYGWNRTKLSKVYYRGQFYYPPFTDSQLISWGMLPGQAWPVISSAWVADMQDAFANGIITVCAAGNSNWRMDTYGGPDFDNYATYNGMDLFISRGSTPGRLGTEDVTQPICVGALGSNANETRAGFSNYGPGVDLYAPGENIVSSVSRAKGLPDSRNANYGQAYASGTSMAAPQITGIVASMMELNPAWNQQQAREWIISAAKQNQLKEADTYGNVYSLGGGANRLAYFPNTWLPTLSTANVTLSISPTTVAENNTTGIGYTFTRSGSTAYPLTVNYTVSGTATLGSDYVTTAFTTTAGVQSVVIPAGVASMRIVVIPQLDSMFENNETVILTLAQGTGYRISTINPVVGTITNVIPPVPNVTLTVSPGVVAENPNTPIVFTFTRSVVTSSPLTLVYEASGTAIPTRDYTTSAFSVIAGTKSIVIPANASSATVVCVPMRDNITEARETVTLRLLTGSGYKRITAFPVTAIIMNS